jgi:hypothetical protein
MNCIVNSLRCRILYISIQRQKTFLTLQAREGKLANTEPGHTLYGIRQVTGPDTQNKLAGHMFQAADTDNWFPEWQ